MHAPSSFLSGFLRAARQTDSGSASPFAGEAPRRAASGTGGPGPLSRPRAPRDGPRYQRPVGAAPPRSGAAAPPGPSCGDRRGSALSSLSPRASGSPGAEHDAQGPRPRRGLSRRPAPSAPSAAARLRPRPSGLLHPPPPAPPCYRLSAVPRPGQEQRGRPRPDPLL